MLDAAVQLEGNLIIRWHEQGFDVRFVPAHAAGAPPTPTRRVPDPAALEKLLTGLGVPRDRVVEVLSSPYVLHSLRVRVAADAAGRNGLVPTAARRAFDVLGGAVRFIARLGPRSWKRSDPGQEE